MIPTFGVNAILTGIGAVLVATAAFTLPFGRVGLTLLGAGAALLLLRLLTEPPVLLAQPDKGRFEILTQRDSHYSAMRVVDHLLPGPGGAPASLRQVRAGGHLRPSLAAARARALAGEAGRIFRAECATFNAVFAQVYVFPRHDRAETDAGSPAWWARPRNPFLAATLKTERITMPALLADAERRWGYLGRSPHKRHDTELYDLAFHADKLPDTRFPNRSCAAGC